MSDANEVTLTADERFRASLDDALRWTARANNGDRATVEQVLPAALDYLRGFSGEDAARALQTLDTRWANRAGAARLTASDHAALEWLTRSLMATMPRTLRQRWSDRAIVLAALYLYGLNCRAQLGGPHLRAIQGGG